jgi:hypothetical protein
MQVGKEPNGTKASSQPSQCTSSYTHGSKSLPYSDMGPRIKQSERAPLKFLKVNTLRAANKAV